jgi:hypothetical protein
MVHTCNPSYSGGGDQRITSSRAAWVKSAGPYIINKTKGPDVVAHICNSNYSGGEDREDDGSRPASSKS